MDGVVERQGAWMILLRPVALSWVGGPDDPTDLCAHGRVEFRIGQDLLVDPATSDELTVSAAGLHLLRSLTPTHRAARPPQSQLFPCCGFDFLAVEGSTDVILTGCPNGIDFDVTVEPSAGAVAVARGGRSWRVDAGDWRTAVHAFADAVADFYVSCAPKTPPLESVAGFRLFIAEWERRRGRAFGA